MRDIDNAVRFDTFHCENQFSNTRTSQKQNFTDDQIEYRVDANHLQTVNYARLRRYGEHAVGALILLQGLADFSSYLVSMRKGLFIIILPLLSPHDSMEPAPPVAKSPQIKKVKIAIVARVMLGEQADEAFFAHAPIYHMRRNNLSSNKKLDMELIL